MSLKKRDTASDAAYWASVEKAEKEWDARKPSWARAIDWSTGGGGVNMEELRVIVEDLTALRADVLRNEQRPSAEAIAQRLSAICDRLTVIVVEHGATPLSGDPVEQVEYPPAGMVSSPAAEGARVIGSVPTGTYAPGETFPIMPLTEGDGHVQSDEHGGVEETGRGVPGGGGSADDHPRGGDPVGAETIAGSPAIAAEAGAGAGEDGAGTQRSSEA